MNNMKLHAHYMLSMMLMEAAGGWQKNARRLESTSVSLFVQCRPSRVLLSEPLGGRTPAWGRQEREGLACEDLKRVESICMIPRPFNSEKLPNSSDVMKEKSHHVGDANISSPQSAIIFSCKIKMGGLRFYEEENNTTDT
jgi:hypothetical protein